MVPKFVKVVPTDYKVIIEKIEQHKLNGLSDDHAAMQAFVEVTKSQKKLVSSK
jgi:glutamate synthase (NADPH) large chain